MPCNIGDLCQLVGEDQVWVRVCLQTPLRRGNSRQLKLQLAPLALAGMSLRNVQQISSDVENNLKCKQTVI